MFFIRSSLCLVVNDCKPTVSVLATSLMSDEVIDLVNDFYDFAQTIPGFIDLRAKTFEGHIVIFGFFLTEEAGNISIALLYKYLTNEGPQNVFQQNLITSRLVEIITLCGVY